MESQLPLARSASSSPRPSAHSARAIESSVRRTTGAAQAAVWKISGSASEIGKKFVALNRRSDRDSRGANEDVLPSFLRTVETGLGSVNFPALPATRDAKLVNPMNPWLSQHRSHFLSLDVTSKTEVFFNPIQ